MLLLPYRGIKDEPAAGTDTGKLSLTRVPDHVDGPHVPFAYENPEAAHLVGPANLHDGHFAWSTVSGLSPKHAAEARRLVQQAAVLGLHHAPSIHYTQGIRRWEGISHRLVAVDGHFPDYADCSAYASWCLWNALHHRFGLDDHVNGQHWLAGYTGTLLQHGRSVRTLVPADLVIYGNGWPGEHVAIYTGGGWVVSHGSESGPRLEPVHYRSDVMSYRRYI